MPSPYAKDLSSEWFGTMDPLDNLNLLLAKTPETTTKLKLDELLSTFVAIRKGRGSYKRP